MQTKDYIFEMSKIGHNVDFAHFPAKICINAQRDLFCPQASLLFFCPFFDTFSHKRAPNCSLAKCICNFLFLSSYLKPVTMYSAPCSHLCFCIDGVYADSSFNFRDSSCLLAEALSIINSVWLQCGQSSTLLYWSGWWFYVW